MSDPPDDDELAPDDPRRPLDPRDYSRRTLLANERTYLAWWRTGLNAIAIGLASARIAPELADTDTHWPYAVLGAAFTVVGIACVVFGEHRRVVVDAAIRRGELVTMSTAMSRVLTGAGVVLGVALLVLIVADP